MISITTVHIHIQNTIGRLKYTGGLCCLGTNGFIKFLTSVFPHEERDTILKSLSYHTMLNNTTTLGTSRGPISISPHLGRSPSSHHHCRAQLLTIMVGPQLQPSASMVDNPTVWLHAPRSTPNRLFFKIFKISGSSIPVMT